MRGIHNKVTASALALAVLILSSAAASAAHRGPKPLSVQTQDWGADLAAMTAAAQDEDPAAVVAAAQAARSGDDAAAVVPLAATSQQPETLPIAWVAPPGVERTPNPCRPGIGERWHAEPGGPDTGLRGPVYLVYQGRLVAVEYEVSQADLSAGRSWRSMPIPYWGRALPIDHVEVRFTPPHEGFEEPHYGVLAWLVGPAERDAITCRS